jgi:DNA recombination protein RmuC
MDVAIAAIAGLIGVALGGGIAFLIFDRRWRTRDSELQTSLALAEQRAADQSAQLRVEKSQTDALRAELADARTRAAELSTQLAAARQNVAEQRELLQDAQARLREAFASVSAEALAKNNEAFLQLARERFKALSVEATGSLDQRKTQIEALLAPLQQILTQYQSRLADIEKSRVESYSMLREQLGSLTEIQRTLNTQTTQLVSALRRPQTRGQWGEITLRRLVELAGMSSRCDFVEQSTVDGEDGRLRPDMVVHLPGERAIVIDCKASLDAFLDASAAADEDARKQCFARHSQQVRARARELSAKSYWSQFKRAPEYVVMFLPGEAFLYAAVEQDGSLVEDCLRNSVIVATPTTLMALLKAIEFGWRQEDISQNVEEIRRHGKDLYDRVAIFAAHFQRLGTGIGSVVETYNESVASLESRLLVSARKIGELGARSDKDIADANPVDLWPRELTAATRNQEPGDRVSIGS